MITQRFSSMVKDGRALVALLLLGLLGCTSVSDLSSANGNPSAANSNSASASTQAPDSNSTNANTQAMDDHTQSASGKLDGRLAAANARFGFKLYAELARQSADKNLFISPASTGLCLAMAYNGAAGETAQAMARALETQGIPMPELNQAYAALKAALENPDAKVQLNIANSLWARQGLAFKPDFIQRTKEYFGAEVTELNFDDPGAAATINRWVSEKTKDKINKIVDRIDGNSILFLINAIYFKGTWSKEFDKAKTTEDNFTPAVGGPKRVPMMSQSGSYRYFENAGFQAVSLPYGGGRASMYIFLPAKAGGLSALQKKLTAANWESWMDEFQQSDGDIKVPRFRLEYEATLNEALKALGMGAAFDQGRANFTGMIEPKGQNVYISQVKHKTFVDVNEEGTEAAAVTSTEMRTTSAMRPRQRFNMVVDRPFFCAIRDNQTGTVLFMGSITDPR